MAITKIIRPLPDAPDSVNDSAPVFNTKANAYVDAQKNQFQPDVNAWGIEANALEVVMNGIKTDIDNIVATIPAGTIDDATATLTNVWSAKKVKDDLSIVNGGNTNGKWTKFPDGTLIQYGEKTILFTNSPTGTGEIEFPTPFIDTEYVVTASVNDAPSSIPAVVYFIKRNVKDKDKTDIGVTLINSTTPVNTNLPIGFTAIGRWK